VVFDASAYRSLAAAGDPEAARAIARHLLDAERARGVHAAASPLVLWELLATAAPRPAGDDAPRGEPTRRAAPDAVARAALVACVAHCALDPALDAAPAEAAAPPAGGTAPRRTFALAGDPDTALAQAVTGAAPPDLAAWPEYLASLAAELAEEPTAARAARLAGPLRHVRDRARQLAEDFADEVQDAVAAAYDAAAPAWDDAASSGERQRALIADADGLPGDDPAPDPDAAGPIAAGTLLDAVLARDPLVRAVAVGRARRARRLAEGRSAHATEFDDTVDDALLADAARVVEQFPLGVALLRELLRRVIAGELDLATRTGRRWFWDAQVAFAAAGPVVSGNATVLEGAGASGGPRGVVTVAEHVQRLGGA
jgi:hypothetical protein